MVSEQNIIFQSIQSRNISLGYHNDGKNDIGKVNCTIKEMLCGG